MAEGEEPQHGGFLPPEPAGPEPELGAPSAPPQEPPTQQQQWAPPAGAWQQPRPGYQQPPGGQAPPGWQPPAGQAPPAGQGPPPGQAPPAGQPPAWQPAPPGYQPPPPPGYPPPGYQQGWYQQPGAAAWAQPREPDNGPAVTGFVLSMVGAGLLLFLLAPISLICSIFGIVYSRRGKRKVERGETRKNKGLAQAGFVSGIVVLVLSVLVTIFEALFVIVYATDEEFRDDFNDDFEQDLDESDGFSAALRLAVAGVRAAVALLT